MTTVVTRNLKQDTTWWASSGTSNYGDTTYAAPVSIKGRWVEEPWIQPTSVGEQSRDMGVVYLDTAQAINIGDHLFLGTSTQADPRNEKGAVFVDHYRTVPALSNKWSVKKAFVCGQ